MMVKGLVQQFVGEKKENNDGVDIYMSKQFLPSADKALNAGRTALILI
jgi:hypothetical protein